MKTPQGEHRGKQMHQADPQTHIVALAAELEKQGVSMPDWAQFVRTGASKARVPTQDNWWQLRAASMLRTIAAKGPIGTQKLRIKYGGRQNRGMAPDKFALASGKIIRTILQQLEKAQLVKQDARGVHKGRVATGSGYALVNKTGKVNA